MAVQIQLRRGRPAQWLSANPVLADGEIGLETDTGQFKVGDGATHWNSMSYGGVVGPAGPQGIQGIQGLQGVKGDTGSQGIQGVKGDTGNTGAQGIPGVKGDTGNTGAQGAKGDTGDQGIQGIKGDTGDTGSQGTPGLKGDTGNTGAQGTPGLKGDTGNQGIQGIQGIQGPVGPTVGYTINVQALTSSPVDAQTIYFGMLPKAPITTANVSKVYIRKAGTIKIAEIYCYSGTAGTAEAWSLYIRKNNTTDTLIATLSVATNERVFSNASLNIAVAAGDYVEIKSINPTWATNPATTIYGGWIYIE